MAHGALQSITTPPLVRFHVPSVKRYRVLAFASGNVEQRQQRAAQLRVGPRDVVSCTIHKLLMDCPLLLSLMQIELCNGVEPQ